MQYPITAAQVSTNKTAVYTLWDGEVKVTVTQHIGAHGFFSAAVLAEFCDSPMECMMYDGYDYDLSSIFEDERGMRTMREWIAEKLNALATGTSLAFGNHSDIKLVA